jgi:signal transduction histidine kinase
LAPTARYVARVLRRLRHPVSPIARFDPLAVDCVFGGVVFVVMEALIWLSPHAKYPGSETLAASLLCFAVAVRRRWILGMLGLSIVAVLVAYAIDGSGSAFGGGPAGAFSSLLVLLLFYGGGAFWDGWRTWTALALGVVLMTIIAITSGQVAANLLWDVGIIAVLPWVVGRWMRERSARARASRARAERLDAEHEYYERVAALGERARLAREIHDVIAHSVSVMVIQSAAARTVLAGEPERAESALRSVERAGREAMAEMRRLLGVLGDGGELRALAPQPGLDELDELIERSRASGLDVSLRSTGEPVTVSPGVGLCAYRVVQEALTNTIKHAGPAHAEVSIRWSPEALELDVTDDGRGEARIVVAGGHGIAGMRERVALHGGSVVAGPARARGFAVTVRIPLLERQAA